MGYADGIVTESRYWFISAASTGGSWTSLNLSGENDMTIESQKLALLEWAGWSKKPICFNGPICWHNPQGQVVCYKNQHQHLPNLNSLDVIAEMEGKLSDDQWGPYLQRIPEVLHRHGRAASMDRNWVQLTAPQRLEALVRTLGLWKGT